MTPYDHDHGAAEHREYAPAEFPIRVTPTIDDRAPNNRDRSRLIRKIGAGVAVVFGVGLASGGIQHYRTHNAAMADEVQNFC